MFLNYFRLLSGLFLCYWCLYDVFDHMKMYIACVSLNKRLHVRTGEKPANLAQVGDTGTHPWFQLELSLRRLPFFLARGSLA